MPPSEVVVPPSVPLLLPPPLLPPDDEPVESNSVVPLSKLVSGPADPLLLLVQAPAHATGSIASSTVDQPADRFFIGAPILPTISQSRRLFFSSSSVSATASCCLTCSAPCRVTASSSANPSLILA